MTAILILRDGQRIEVRGISQEYVWLLLSFGIFAGYILKPQ